MKTAVVVTSISAPNAVLRSISQGSSERGWSFLVVGDRKSPPEFQLDGARFYSLAKQSLLISNLQRFVRRVITVGRTLDIFWHYRKVLTGSSKQMMIISRGTPFGSHAIHPAPLIPYQVMGGVMCIVYSQTGLFGHGVSRSISFDRQSNRGY